MVEKVSAKEENYDQAWWLRLYMLKRGCPVIIPVRGGCWLKLSMSSFIAMNYDQAWRQRLYMLKRGCPVTVPMRGGCWLKLSMSSFIAMNQKVGTFHLDEIRPNVVPKPLNVFLAQQK